MPNISDMIYVHHVPESIPEGKVLVHNHIAHKPTTEPGTNGFRAWLQAPEPNHLRRCYCGWAAKLEHYARRGRETTKAPLNRPRQEP
jgi:hypothetical protein